MAKKVGGASGRSVVEMFLYSSYPIDTMPHTFPLQVFHVTYQTHNIATHSFVHYVTELQPFIQVMNTFLHSADSM
jgi:hypothetical protein